MKEAILLLNFGGPDTLDDVQPFLFRLFSDPNILTGMPGPVRRILARLISMIRAPSSKKAYAAIGGGSPQRHWTESQAQALQKLTGNRVCIGMRASEPSIESALRDLQSWGAEKIVCLPLFPQFSTTTTGSCFDEVGRVLAKLGTVWQPQLRFITEWCDHPLFIELLKNLLAETLQKTSGEEKLHILFSAHSLPMKIVNAGDPYPQQVERTVKAITQGLNVPWSLAYQSRNGRMPWLEPYIEHEIPRLAREGIRSLVVLPISFVSDHIETLWELDHIYAELARDHGIEHYHRVPAINDHPQFSPLLQTLATRT